MTETDKSTNPNPIVRLEGVTRVYGHGSTAVRAAGGISMQIAPGEFTVLSGPSGSGKTTVLNLIGALDVATEGRVYIEGRDLGTLRRAELAALRRDRIGFVFQAYNLVPVLTALENAEFVLALQGIEAAERRIRVLDMLERVGLEGLADRRPSEMSGGQQQRVAIARAIVTEPAIVLADEPTANVDSATAESLLDVMEKLNDERGVTFLFSTHDPRVMARARRLIHLHDGRIENDEHR